MSKSNEKKLIVEEGLHLRDEFIMPKSDFVTVLVLFLNPPRSCDL